MRASIRIAVLAALAAAGCGKQLNPDYCLTHPSDQDCQGAGLVVYDAAPPCVTNDMCSADRPVCDMGTCVQCLMNMDCKDPQRAFCGDDHLCHGCSNDQQCATDQVCVDQSCVASNDVLYAAPDGMGSGTTCTKTAPCTLEQALATIDGGQGDYIQLVMAGGTYSPGASSTITRSVKLAGPDPSGQNLGIGKIQEADLAQVVAPDGLQIMNATVELDYLVVRGSGGDGLTCSGGQLTLDNVVVDHNAKDGVVSDGCALIIRHASLHDNTNTAISANDAAITIHNVFVYKNGNKMLDAGAVHLTGKTSGQLRFDTIAYNDGKGGKVNGVRCELDGGSTVDAGEDIITGNAATQVSTGGGCDFSRSYTGAQDKVHFASMTDLHLTMTSPAEGGAVTPPNAVRDISGAVCDVLDDLDGQARPYNTFCDRGADEFVP